MSSQYAASTHYLGTSAPLSVAQRIKRVLSVFKVRIGVAIMLCALAGIAVMPTSDLSVFQVFTLALAVLLSSASAGAFNQYVERDLDRQMRRTRNRPFATGQYVASKYWLLAIGGLLFVSVGAAAWATNYLAALYVFLGAFTYGVVYTVWLKRRTWMNIVIGGLAGSFAVLAGSAAVDPNLSTAAILLAVVLFLWTPPHFWSLAFAYKDDYEAAGVPMLPVVVSPKRAAHAIFVHTLLLSVMALVPFFYGMGWIYLVCALFGGLWFLRTSIDLVRHPDRLHAMKNFHVSLIQLSLLLVGAMLDAAVI